MTEIVTHDVAHLEARIRTVTQMRENLTQVTQFVHQISDEPHNHSTRAWTEGAHARVLLSVANDSLKEAEEHMVQMVGEIISSHPEHFAVSEEDRKVAGDARA